MVRRVAVIAVGAIAAGYLLLKLLDPTGRSVVKCSNCGLPLRKRYDICPKCGSHLIWDFKEAKIQG